MHPSYPDIFAILRQSLFPSHQDTDAIHNTTPSVTGLTSIIDNATVSGTTKTDLNIDWNYIYSEMQAQAVSSLAYPWLKNHTIPDYDLQNKWMTSCLQQQARWIQIMYAQDNLITLMEQNNIPCVIIKGAAAMIAYPQPTVRAMGDIDFLVKREDYDKTASLLENNGYQLEHEKNPTKHHYNYKKDGISFELHKRLDIITTTNESLLSLFEKGIDNRVWHSLGRFRFPVLPTELNGLVLLFHINQHLREGIGLRQIIDWMMYLFINNNLEDIMPIIKTTGLETLALTVTIMCQKYLGLPVIVDPSDNYPYDDLLQYIMTKGNMGKKSGIKGRISSFTITTRNPIVFFKRLQESGVKTWKDAKKHPILRPFAWIYRIRCVYREILLNRISIKEVYNSRKDGITQRRLIKSLGLDTDKYIPDNDGINPS